MNSIYECLTRKWTPVCFYQRPTTNDQRPTTNDQRPGT